MTDPYIQINGTKIEVFDNDLSAVRTPKQLSDGTYVINNTKCRAYLIGAQNNLTDSTWTKVLLDAESYDVGNNFANNKFTVPVTGYYQVNGHVEFGSVVNDKRYAVAIYVNGGAACYSYANSGTADGAVGVHVSDILFLAATQYVELYCVSVAGVSTVDLQTGTALTYLSIHLLSI